MLETILSKFGAFRNEVYQFFSARRDASFELVDALSSNTQAQQVVQLSLNPCYRRNYCSITRSVDEYYPDKENKSVVDNRLTQLLGRHGISDSERNYILLAVDSTPAPRNYSPTQYDRGYVYCPLQVADNKPITVGHQYSVVCFLPEKGSDSCAPWVTPLSCRRVNSDQRSALVGMEQVEQCIEHIEGLSEKLVICVADSHYSQPDCIKIGSKHENYVHISRIRSNRVLYYPAKEACDEKKVGRKKQYGQAFKLSDESTWDDPSETKELSITNKKGKPLRVNISCWDDMRMRGKRESNISTLPIRLLRICISGESDDKPFKKPLWLIVSGETVSDSV